jgi:histone deacetylase 11
MVSEKLGEAIDEFKPEFLIYNAGTDCLCGDPLGALNISEQGIITRDEIVFEYCLKQGIPLTMIMSGGYQ